MNYSNGVHKIFIFTIHQRCAVYSTYVSCIVSCLVCLCTTLRTHAFHKVTYHFILIECKIMCGSFIVFYLSLQGREINSFRDYGFFNFYILHFSKTSVIFIFFNNLEYFLSYNNVFFYFYFIPDGNSLLYNFRVVTLILFRSPCVFVRIICKNI